MNFISKEQKDQNGFIALSELMEFPNLGWCRYGGRQRRHDQINGVVMELVGNVATLRRSTRSYQSGDPQKTKDGVERAV